MPTKATSLNARLLPVTRNFNSHDESLQSTPVRSSLFHNIPRGLSRPLMRVDLRAAAPCLNRSPGLTCRWKY